MDFDLSGQIPEEIANWILCPIMLRSSSAVERPTALLPSLGFCGGADSAGFARRSLVEAMPGAAELAGGVEAGLFGDAFHVDACFAQQFLSVGDTEPVAVIG